MDSQTKPVVSSIISMIAKVPEAVLSIGFIVLIILSDLWDQSALLWCWAFLNVCLSMVQIAKKIDARTFQYKDVLWLVLAFMLFVFGVIFAQRTPKISYIELVVLSISTVVISFRYPKMGKLQES